MQLWPDYRLLHMWYRTCRADKRDDSILLGVIAEFARDGMTFESALDYCPELLVKEGILTRRGPSAAELKDIEFGWGLAKEMGRLDVGQSVAIKEQAALAIEAIEGTDRCIERAEALCRAGGWTLVKVAKPQQDMRFDVPTVGTSTIENLHKARARVLAIEAGKTIVIDQPEVVELANRYGLTIIALPGRTPRPMSWAPARSAPLPPPRFVGGSLYSARCPIPGDRVGPRPCWVSSGGGVGLIRLGRGRSQLDLGTGECRRCGFRAG